MTEPELGSFRCLLLGEEPLVVRCAEVLLERGHFLIGVVSTAPAVLHWARERAVPVLRRAEYPALLLREPVDLLLSITHPALIAAQDLARVKRAAINYHDGPLPRYAGMNGSAWALANGESNHAIVWHHLTAGLDEGDILERRDIELEARETSLSLNMRNAALALESFRTLLGRLERNDFTGIPQDRSVARLIYSRHDRPPALATVDWLASADEIDRLIRACDFGNYPNRFGLVKIVHGQHAVLAREAQPVAGAGQPGTLLHLADSYLDVACGKGALRIQRLATLTGVPLSARATVALLGLEVGQSLQNPSRPACESISRRIAEAEPAFVVALRDRSAPVLPFESPVSLLPSSTEVDLPPEFLARFSSERVASVAALYGFVLSCLLRQDSFDLALVDANARASLSLNAAAALLFPATPLRVRVEAQRGFSVLVAALAGSLQRQALAPAFLADLIARHPALGARGCLSEGEISPIALLVGEASMPPGAALALAIREEKVELLSDGRVEPARVQELATQLLRIAEAVAGDAERTLSGLSLLDSKQLSQQLFGWNDTARDFPASLRLHDLFEGQVELRPHDVALVCDGRSQSFLELERSANRIANALQSRGIGPGQYVGLLVERGFELVASMLGIIKAGAAYIPIDPVFPEERARLMLQDAGCRVSVVSTRFLGRVAGASEALQVEGAELLSAPETRPHCSATADDVCYAIYTSGSTGIPKGVVLKHRAVMNTIDWVNRTFEVSAKDRLLFVTSPSFDLSVYDVFGALGAGASLEIALPTLLSEPAELVRRLSEPGITIWDSAPPALSRLTSFLPEKAPSSTLRLVMLSGDWIPVSLPSVLQKTFGGVKVKSLGGATEAAIWSNHYSVESVDPSWRSIPYGYPIQNAYYYVLDHHLRPLPVGVPGDLYIGGVCLAEGYLKRAELSAERFIEDPFRPDQRIYKTGDLARYFRDGTLEFLGRADFQVKIRGFRVEMGEVEAAIGALDSVREAVCAAIVDASGQKSLIAYVVPRAGVVLDEASVRSSLSRSLPDFMVPSRVIALSALPLSSNGKVDRKALPDPRTCSQSGPVEAPRTGLERKLVELWEELLQKQPIGIHDDFFALGGHSLLATLLVTRIANRLGIDIPLSQLVSSPTIAKLSQLVEARRSGAQLQHQYIQRMNLAGNGIPLYMTSGVGGHVFIFQEVAERLSGKHAIFGIRAVGADGECEPCANLRDVAAIYVEELLRKPPTRPIVLGGYSLGAPVAFELAHQLLDRGVQIRGMVFVDGFAPGHPHKLPFFRRMLSHVDHLRAAPAAERKAMVQSRLQRLASRLGEKVGVALFIEKNIGVRRDDELYKAMDPKLKRQLTQLWMKMHAAGDSYVLARRLSLPLLLLKSGIPFVGTIDDPTNGWNAGFDGPIEVVRLPCDHDSMVRGPAMRQIAAEIQRWLAQWEEPLDNALRRTGNGQGNGMASAYADPKAFGVSLER